MKETIKRILKLIPSSIKKFLYGEIKEDLREIKSEFNSSEKEDLKYKVLSFASSLRRGEKHTTQEFETIFNFHDRYERLIEKLGERNGFTHSEFEYIKGKYKEKMEGSNGNY